MTALDVDLDRPEATGDGTIADFFKVAGLVVPRVVFDARVGTERPEVEDLSTAFFASRFVDREAEVRRADEAEVDFVMTVSCEECIESIHPRGRFRLDPHQFKRTRFERNISGHLIQIRCRRVAGA